MTATRTLVAVALARAAVLAAIAVAALLLASRARAATDEERRSAVTSEIPAALRNVDIEEKLGSQVPLDATFRDAQGRGVALRDLVRGDRPVVLALAYYNCPMLCGLVLAGIARGMRESGLDLGADFRAVALSFDPGDDAAIAAERQRGYLQTSGRPGRTDAWAFLTGEKAQIDRVTDAVGFRYQYDAATKQFAHAAAVVVLTPGGQVSRYLYGIDYPGHDVRLALLEAGQGRVGTSLDRLVLRCYRYDPASRRYAPYALAFVRAGALAVLAALGGLLGVLWRREAKGRRK